MIQTEKLTWPPRPGPRSPGAPGARVSPTSLLLALLMCVTAGAVTAAGHPTACGNINNEKVFVNALYADVLGRDPDRERFRLWRNRIIRCGADAGCADNARANIALEFFGLSEFQAKTGINVSDHGQFVRALYLYLLRRQPDPNGYDQWVSYLNQTGDRAGVARAFITSDDYRARCFPEAHLLLRFGAGYERAGDPDYIAQNWRRMQRQAPFLDGVTVIARSDDGIDLADRLITSSPVDQYPLTQTTQKIRTATDGWRRSRTFTDNFILLRGTPPKAYGSFTSWFDDQFWAQVNRNAARMARFAKDSGLKGFFLDPEQYPEHVPIWTCAEMAPGDSLDPAVCGDGASVPAAYAEIVKRRGREFMRSVLDQYPDVTIMTTFGHSFVHFVGGVGLHAGFVDGMLETIQARGARHLYDGVEVYSRPHDPEGLYVEALGGFDSPYQDVRYWGTGWYYSLNRWAQQNYELGSLPYWLDAGMPPYPDAAQIKEVVRRTLNASDRYAWLYSERSSFFNDANVPQDVVAALCRAKAEAAGGSAGCAAPAAPFDFDGDGKADVSVFRPTDGRWYLSRSQDGFTAEPFGLATDVLAPADYDGDGKTDIAVWRPSDGTWYLQRSQLGFTAVHWGQEGDRVAPGDFDGDGLTDVAVFRPAEGTWYIRQSSNNGFRAVPFGVSEDQPVPGDYDGDGKTDIAVWRPSEGAWYVLSSQFGTYRGTRLGSASDKPVPADYDGDGRTDLAVYRPANGIWYLLRSRDGSAEVWHGAPEDVPAPADYDGDARADVAVFRPSNGHWYVKRSAGGDAAEHFGMNGDKPIPSAYVR